MNDKTKNTDKPKPSAQNIELSPEIKNISGGKASYTEAYKTTEISNSVIVRDSEGRVLYSIPY